MKSLSKQLKLQRLEEKEKDMEYLLQHTKENLKDKSVLVGSKNRFIAELLKNVRLFFMFFLTNRTPDDDLQKELSRDAESKSRKTSGRIWSRISRARMMEHHKPLI